MDRICKQCGGSMESRSVKTAMYCMPCSQARAKVRIATPNRRRNFTYSAVRIEGGWGCVDCRSPVHQYVTKDGRKRRPPVRCDACRNLRNLWSEVLSGRSAAQSAVSRAKRDGILPSAEGMPCSDCPRTAECYDHRDYGRPLQVDPVCRSCNSIRGHAKPVNQCIVFVLLTRLIDADGSPEVPDQKAVA